MKKAIALVASFLAMTFGGFFLMKLAGVPGSQEVGHSWYYVFGGIATGAVWCLMVQPWIEENME